MRDEAQRAGGGGHGSPQFDPKASVHPSPRGSHLVQSYGCPTVKGREAVRGTLSAWPLSTCDPASEKGKKNKPVITIEVSRSFRPKANMSIGSRGPEGIGHELGESLCGAAGVGYQLGHNLRVLPAWRPRLPHRLLAPIPAVGRGLVGAGGPASAPPQPLTLDRHRDLNHSREHQPSHQERFNLLGVRSHKSQAWRFIASRSGIDHGEKATSPSYTHSSNKVENVKYTRPTPGAWRCGQCPMSLWWEVTYASRHPILLGRLREAVGTSQATAGVHDLGDSCLELKRAGKVQAWVGDGAGLPDPPFCLLRPAPGNTSPALSSRWRAPDPEGSCLGRGQP